MLEGLGVMGLAGPKAMGMENVPGMLTHPHWHHVRDLIEFFGFRVQWMPVIGLEKKLPHVRQHLLLIPTRSDGTQHVEICGGIHVARSLSHHQGFRTGWNADMVGYGRT